MASVEDGREEEEEIEIQESVDEQDAEPLRIARDPKLPSHDDVECHRCSHIPFRDWCRHCVLGRGRGDPHLRTTGSSIAIVGLDYFFIEHDQVKKRKELDFAEDAAGEAALEDARASGTLVKCLVIRCAATKCLFGHVVPRKGADEEDFAAGLVVKAVEWLGHTELIIKGDNEPALQALISRSLELVRVKVERVTRISSEAPPAYDSQSNGGIEVGVMLIRGMFRTLRLCLETRIGRTIPVDHPVIPWLLEHTCLLMNVKTRGADGLTGWARARGRNFSQKLLGFGEKILYKLPVKGPQAPANMAAKWADGVFIGYARHTNTYVMATREGGIATSRSLKRVPMANRWCPETLAQITSTPWSRRERSSPEVRFQEPAVTSEEPVAVAPPPPTRRFRITDTDLRNHGFTDGCVQCSHIQRYGKTKAGTQHNDACRNRVLEEIGKTTDGDARITAHTARTDRFLAEHIEHHDQQVTPGHLQHRVADPPAHSPGVLPTAVPPAHPRPTDASIDAGINARLLQPDDDIHRQIAAGRGDSIDEDITENADENNGDMDIDDDDAMGFIGSL